MQDARTRLEAILRERIAVLDGSWGVLIQRQLRGEEAYRGERFSDHPRDVAGDPDLLNLTRPEVVLGIHRDYFAAGADIATTNTFTATTIGQADYALEAHAYEMNVAGAQLARAGGRRGRRLRRRLRRAAERDAVAVACASTTRLTGRTRSTRSRDAYAEQVRGLAEGGVDFLLIETIFDTLNAKAAIAAALDDAPELAALDLVHRDRPQRPQPLRPDGRRVLALGRARASRSSSASTARSARRRCGRSSKTSRASPRPGWRAIRTRACRTRWARTTSSLGDTSRLLREFAQDGLVNVVGGCCGTTPEHVKAITDAVQGSDPETGPDRRAR